MPALLISTCSASVLLLDLRGEPRAPRRARRGRPGRSARRRARRSARRASRGCARGAARLAPRAARSRATPRPSPSVAPVMRTVVSSIGRMPAQASPVAHRMRTYVRALEEPGDRAGGAGPAAGLRRGRGAPFRRSGGARHPVLRGPRQVGPQRGAEGLAHAVPVDDQPVSRMLACLRLLRLGRHAGPHGRRPDAQLRGTSAPETRSTARRRAALPALRAHEGARPLDRSSSRVPRDARRTGPELVTSGDHRSPEQPRLEARDGHRAGPARSART